MRPSTPEAVYEAPPRTMIQGDIRCIASFTTSDSRFTSLATTSMTCLWTLNEDLERVTVLRERIASKKKELQRSL
jgi:hypothetical protein